MKNRLFYGIFFAALVFAAPSLRAQTRPDHHGSMPKPTNLQVLPKDISHQDLMKVMHGFAGSLGVKCTFCHVAGPQPHQMNFASDAKPEKRIARTMMRMTNSVNATYLTQVSVPDATPDRKNVTCGTCHRGQSIPASFVPPKEDHHG
jgi:Photosynthetic reaction centre cytochrome C subunit